MKDNLYSSKSDVWAFAIVLWEIGTLGKFYHKYIFICRLIKSLEIVHSINQYELGSHRNQLQNLNNYIK